MKVNKIYNLIKSLVSRKEQHNISHQGQELNRVNTIETNFFDSSPGSRYRMLITQFIELYAALNKGNEKESDLLIDQFIDTYAEKFKEFKSLPLEKQNPYQTFTFDLEPVSDSIVMGIHDRKTKIFYIKEDIEISILDYDKMLKRIKEKGYDIEELNLYSSDYSYTCRFLNECIDNLEKSGVNRELAMYFAKDEVKREGLLDTVKVARILENVEKLRELELEWFY